MACALDNKICFIYYQAQKVLSSRVGESGESTYQTFTFFFISIFFFRFRFRFGHFIFALARTKRVRLATSLIPVRVKGLSPVTLHTHRKPIQTVSFRAVGSSIIVCREIWPNQIGNCRQHCEAVLENALEKAVRDPPPPASTSKFDFLYSTLSGRQTKEIAEECGRERKKKKENRKKEKVYK